MIYNMSIFGNIGFWPMGADNRYEVLVFQLVTNFFQLGVLFTPKTGLISQVVEVAVVL